MAPILASSEVPVGHTALKIRSLPFLEYELSIGSSHAKVSRDGAWFFMCERKASNLMYCFMVILFY